MNEYFNQEIMNKARLQEVTCLFSSDEYIRYCLVRHNGDLYDIYMMLEYSTGSQKNWIITIPRGRFAGDKFVNVRIYDGISLYDIDKRLEGKYTYVDDYEMVRIVLYSLMNGGKLPK